MESGILYDPSPGTTKPLKPEIRLIYNSCITLSSLNCNSGIFLIMGSAGFVSSTLVFSHPKPQTLNPKTLKP